MLREEVRDIWMKKHNIPCKKPADHQWVVKLADNLETCPVDEQSTSQTECPSLQRD